MWRRNSQKISELFSKLLLWNDDNFQRLSIIWHECSVPVRELSCSCRKNLITERPSSVFGDQSQSVWYSDGCLNSSLLRFAWTENCCWWNCGSNWMSGCSSGSSARINYWMLVFDLSSVDSSNGFCIKCFFSAKFWYHNV